MRQTAAEKPWLRLSQEHAMNFIATGLIAQGHDRGELVIGSDPCPHLKKIAEVLDVELGECFPPCGGDMNFSGSDYPNFREISGAQKEIIALARLIGYRGDTILGIADYLTSWHTESTHPLHRFEYQMEGR